METVLLVVHLMLVAALIALILVQRSEGGALGIGGGGNFMATRGTGSVLTRATTFLAAGFFITSIVLTIIAQGDSENGGIFDNLPANPLPEDGGERPVGGVLDLLGGPAGADETPVVPNEAGGAGDPAAGAADPGAGGAPVIVPNEAGGGAPAGAPNDAAPVIVPNN